MLNYKNWTELLSSTRIDTRFNMHLDHQNLRLHLCGCVTLAQQIQHFFPNLLINPKHGTVDIYIAGSAIFESVNYGDNYRALSLFLPQIEFLNAVHIHLIGPDIEFESFDTEAVLDNSVGQNISFESVIRRVYCAEWASRFVNIKSSWL